MYYNGQTKDTYYWYPGDYLDVPEEDSCWSDDAGSAKLQGVKFGPGQALWVYGSSTDQGFQTAGQVCTSDIVMQLQNGATAVGNAFPTEVDLQDILPSGPNCEYNIQIQTLYYNGQTKDTYYWYPGDYLDVPEENPCWSDDAGSAKLQGIKFPAGQGLWIYGSSTSQYITIPAPEL